MAKAIAKITAEASCPPGKDQIIVRFDAVKGFGLRVTRNQAKSYVIEYSIKSTGRGRRQTIGDVSVWTPEVAIVEARRLLQLVDRGKDPAAEQSADVAAPTVAGLVEKWRTEWAPHLRPRTREEAEKLIKAYIIPKLGKTKIAAVKPSDVARLHRGITARVSANRVVSLPASCVTPRPRSNGILRRVSWNGWSRLCQSAATSRPRMSSRCCCYRALVSAK
jgi:hypothetical protein